MIAVKTHKYYKIKEAYYTLQGEGARVGRPAVFCRFTGCNLWSGLEKDRDTAICKFCDTNFWGMDGENGGSYTANELSELIMSLWPHNVTSDTHYVVLTGGEPALQIDEHLVGVLRNRGFEVAIETNGTIALPSNLDWITLSPKAGSEIVVRKANELKLVYPQKGIDPQMFVNGEYENFYLQPLFDDQVKQHEQLCLNYCLEHPRWKLSLQLHKILKIA